MSRKIILGLVLTLVLFVAAKRISVNQSRAVSESFAGREIYHSTVYEQVGAGRPEIRLRIDPPPASPPRVIFRYPDRDKLYSHAMESLGETGWSFKLPEGEKGTRLGYAFEVPGTGNETKRIPAGDAWFALKYKGEVSILVLILHVIFMFGSFFFMIESFLCALDVLSKGADMRLTVIMARGVMFFCFIGGWPLGFILNYQRFGPLWEGFPFGYDVTDNKTQLMFLFWIVTVLLAAGSFAGKSKKFDLVSAKTYAIAVIVSFIASLAIFLIPHSL
ncbi:MAG: hypothetical protein JXB45_05840 [Candidatus Krumholzibacteriota bacterium]|nr:hypothetical protein [Candidatus Krumholzibacteriota bacterium]